MTLQIVAVLVPAAKGAVQTTGAIEATETVTTEVIVGTGIRVTARLSVAPIAIASAQIEGGAPELPSRNAGA